MEDGNVKEKVRFYQNEIEKNFTQYCKEDKRLRNLLKENMDKIIDFIHEKIDENNIFIHCYNGTSISPLIVAIYMIKKGEISKDTIHDILRSKNKDICLDFDLSIF